MQTPTSHLCRHLPMAFAASIKAASFIEALHSIHVQPKDCRRHVARYSLLVLVAFFGAVIPSARLTAQFSFQTFSRSDSICYSGDAQFLMGGVVRLSPSLPFQKGAIWHRRKQPVTEGFTTKFYFRLGDNGSGQEADGIAFVIQNADSCALGAHAQGIGYEGIPNSIAVEFDTWYNSGVDPNNNHVSIHTQGVAPNRADFAGAIATRESVPILGLGVPHVAIIDYDGTDLRVYLGECETPILEARVNLDSLLRLDGGRAWVGLTASTGGNYQNHDIMGWEFQLRDRTTTQKCFGDSAMLEGPIGFTRYEWSTGETTRAITVHQSGTYQLFASGNLLCPEEEVSFEFNVSITRRTFQPFIFPSGPIIICRGDSAVLTILTGPYEGDSFFWSTGDTTRSIVATKSGKYAVTLVDPNGCEYRLDTVQVFIRPNPEPNILPGDTILLCSGDSVRLWVPDVFSTYSWSTGARDTAIIASRPGTYTLTVTDRDGCEGYDTAVVLMPDGISVSNDTTICPGDIVPLSAFGRTDYRWSPAEGLSCVECPSPFASPARTTEYIVFGTNDGDCPSYDTVTVTVRSVSVDAGVDTSLCLGDTIRLRGSGDGTYSWSPAASVGCSDCPDPLVAPLTTTMFYLTLTDRSGCTGVDSVLVTVRSAGSIEAGADTAVCSGGSIELSAVGAQSYRWSPAAGLSCTDCPNPIATPETTTLYYVTGTNDPDDCPSLDSVTVRVVTAPDVDAGADTTVCGGTSIRLGGTGAMRYQWNPSSDLSCLDCPEPIASPKETTTYRVTGFNAEGCSATDSVQVVVRPGVVVDAGSDVVICAGENVQLRAVGGIQWLWEPSDGLSCTDCPDPIAAPDRTTKYHVTAWNVEGCRGVDTIVVNVMEEPEKLRLLIARDYHGKTDTPIIVSVESVVPIGPVDLSELTFEITFDGTVMSIDKHSFEKLIAGTALEGWSVEILFCSPGRFVVRLTAPAGERLSVDGTLLQFETRLYLSDTRGTELPFTITSVNPCYAFETEAGYIQLDSICGVNLRLIELTAAKFVPPVAHPNPARERVTFDFGIGLDGPTRLEVFDVLGNRVGLVLDATLDPGRYGVEWDIGELPPGTYWYRLTSGGWSEGGEVRIHR